MLDFDSPGAWTGQRVCVVSPHPDDDVLGCGGTLARAWAAGAALLVLYVSDGSASHTGSSTYPPDRLRRVREEEARAALGILGVPATQLHFMREPDGELARTGPGAAALAERIGACFARFAPSMVFSPWIRDGHTDHVATSLAVRRALGPASSATTLYEYTVWPEEVDAPDGTAAAIESEVMCVDVRAYRDRKAHAIRAHRSQLGGLIVDAATAFSIPASLLERSDVERECFFRVAPEEALP